MSARPARRPSPGCHWRLARQCSRTRTIAAFTEPAAAPHPGPPPRCAGGGRKRDRRWHPASRAAVAHLAPSPRAARGRAGAGGGGGRRVPLAACPPVAGIASTGGQAASGTRRGIPRFRGRRMHAGPEPEAGAPSATLPRAAWGRAGVGGRGRRPRLRDRYSRRRRLAGKPPVAPLGARPPRRQGFASSTPPRFRAASSRDRSVFAGSIHAVTRPARKLAVADSTPSSRETAS